MGIFHSTGEDYAVSHRTLIRIGIASPWVQECHGYYGSDQLFSSWIYGPLPKKKHVPGIENLEKNPWLWRSQNSAVVASKIPASQQSSTDLEDIFQHSSSLNDELWTIDGFWGKGK